MAQVDRLAVGTIERQAFAKEHVGRAEVQRLGLAAVVLDLPGESLIDFAGQDPLDDGQRGVVGVAASLDEARLQTGVGHGAADGRPAAMDQDGPHAHRLHEDDVQQQVGHRPRVFHHAAAELDDRDLAAELPNPREGFDEDIGFLNRFFQLRMLQTPLQESRQCGCKNG